METTTIVRKLIGAVVPERVTEIDAIMEIYAAQFRQFNDRDGFNLFAGGFSAIQYTSRSNRRMWLFGYAGWQALQCYGDLIFNLQLSGETLDINKVQQIPNQPAEEDAFRQILESVKKLQTACHEDDFDWPSNIPEPENGRPLDQKFALVYDLTCMATIYVFLHKLKHVMFSVDGNSPEDANDEEYQCDLFARDMMISKIDHYAAISGYPGEQVRMKRMMGIALASAFILFVTGKGRLAGSDSHPPVHRRWLETVKDVRLRDNDRFWLYFSSLILALLKYFSIAIEAKVVKSYRSLCLDLISDLENGI